LYQENNTATLTSSLYCYLISHPPPPLPPTISTMNKHLAEVFSQRLDLADSQSTTLSISDQATVSDATEDLPEASTLNAPSPTLIDDEYYQGLDWKRVPDL
ncbi:hypothetical protein P154DRAFT_605769, partial [Amniculicola lignicola CBS 123094]